MLDSLWSGLAGIVDSLLDPQIVAISEVNEKLGLLVVVGISLVFYGMSREVFKEYGKLLAIGMAAVLVVGVVSMESGLKIVMFLFGILASVFKAIAGASITYFAFESKEYRYSLPILVLAALLLGVFVLPSLGSESLILMKVTLAIFSAVALYRSAIELGLHYSMTENMLLGSVILMAGAGLVSFSEYPYGVPWFVDYVIFKYPFGVGLACGLAAAIRDLH